MKIRTQILFVIAVLIVGISIGVSLEFRKRIPPLVITRSVEHVPQENERVNLLVFGDFGSGDDLQRKVAELVNTVCEKEKSDAILTVGDNIYDHGVTSTDDPQWNTKVFDMYNGSCSGKLKIYAALGNHDYEGNAKAQIEMTNVNPRWQMPARFYKVAFGSLVDLVVVDTNFPDKCGFSACSLTWAENELQASNAIWKIVTGHHPLASGGRYPKPKAALGATLPNTLCDGKANAFFSGHDHNLQHLKGKMAGSSCAFNHFISGAGGGEVPTPVNPVAGLTEFALATPGILSVTYTPQSADYKFYDAHSGLVVYQYVERAGLNR